MPRTVSQILLEDFSIRIAARTQRGMSSLPSRQLQREGG
jgi:hypothetical protein